VTEYALDTRTRADARDATAGSWRRALHYTRRSALITAKNWSFVLFSVAMPVALYLVFSQVFGSAGDAESTAYRSTIMVAMAAYGSLGAALGGGAQLAVERRSGWFRQLSVTALPPKAFLWAKAAVIMLLVLPSIALVFVAGFAVGGVRLSLGQWLAALGLLWLALLPMAVLGIVIGLWAKAEAVQGVTTLVLLLLAMLGGLWFPAALMPPVMQTIAQVLPSYWLAELGRYPLLGGSFPWLGVLVLGLWSAALTGLGALGYRRAVASSKR
jgi:ABC-2 type transport system permease protein